MESHTAGPTRAHRQNGSHSIQRASLFAPLPAITDDDLLHLAIAYVKNAHGTSPDFLTRVAVMLEALREGRTEWKRTDAAASPAPGSLESNGHH
jgi:hypothetical protein